MLCYHSQPGTYATVAGKPVRGYQLGFPATYFTHKEYCANRDSLIQAPFTPKYIESRMCKDGFPYRAYFTLDMIRNLEYRTLQQIATFMGVNALLTRTKIIYSVRNSLRDL